MSSTNNDSFATPSNTKPEGELVMRTLAMPQHTNANGDIFGGWLVSQMDLGGAIIAKQQAHSRVATVAIETMVFITPVKIGDMVSTYAKLEKIGRTSMRIKVEVWATKLTDHAFVNVKVTEGIFTFVAIDENNKPWPVVRT